MNGNVSGSKSPSMKLRYVELTWSLFLFGYLYFIGIWQVLVLRINTKTTNVTTRLEYVLIIICMFNNEHHIFFLRRFYVIMCKREIVDFDLL